MKSSLGFAVLMPAAAVGLVNTCAGAIKGGAVFQVLDLVSGSDATTSFDPYLPASNTIVQLTTTPSVTHPHLVVFTKPGEPPPGVRFGVGYSIGSASGTVGSVSASGVKAGDIILNAYSPVTDYALISGGRATITNYASSFAPTAPADGVVTQITGIPTPAGVASDSILFFLRKAGSPAPDMEISLQSDPVGSPLSAPPAVAGQKVLSAIDITNAVDYTAGYCPFIPNNGLIIESGSVLPSNILGDVLFLFGN